MAAKAQYRKQRRALPQHRRLVQLEETARKNTQNAQNPGKTPIARSKLFNLCQNRAVSVEKRPRETV